MALRWGIVSAGKISHDFVTSLGTVPKDEHTVIAIAARDIERAEEFAKLHEIPRAYGSYNELAEASDVDVVYIGALNPQHYELGLLMLEHGKHLLVEKPMCMNETRAKNLIALAEEKKLFLMEAVKSRFFPAYQYVRKQIEEGQLGTIQEVDVSFGFEHSAERVHKRLLGGGAILNIGIYVIQLAQWAFQEPPLAIKAIGELNEDGVDTSVEGTLEYSEGRIAKIQASSVHKLENKAVIKGTKGQITLPQFWCPTSLIDVDGSEKKWDLPTVKHKTNYPNSGGLRFQADEVRRCILEGRLQSEHMNHSETLLLARIADALRRQVGVAYAEDRQ